MASVNKILERMRQTKHGFHSTDLDRVYTKYGFKKREGGNHTVYKHSRFPELRATVARHTTVGAAYVEDLIQNINRLQELLATAQDETDEQAEPLDAVTQE
jgi:hypothetical protein